MPASDMDKLAAITIELKQRIGARRYEMWFKNKAKFSLRPDALRIAVPNQFLHDWLERTFCKTLIEVCRLVLGEAATVLFQIDPESFPAIGIGQPPAPTASPNGEVKRDSPTITPNSNGKPTGGKTRKRKWRQLADFIVGPCNRVAHAAAMSVVETPEMCPTPLVLYGATGTGKTHLLEGIYAELRRRHPEWRVCFITAEDFTHRYVQSTRFDNIESFRKQYRGYDAFLLDDLDYLETKRATQNEFVHTLDVLQAEQCPVVVTCDCHPRLADQYCDELTDRLIGGAAWELAAPDVQTRRALLDAKVSRTLFSDEVVEFLAVSLTGNVRELEGALHTLHHYQRVHGGQIDLTMAKEALHQLLHRRGGQIQLEDIKELICVLFGLDKRAMQSKKRDWQISHPRMLAMYLARKYTGASYSEIGRYFGKRNHSTVVAACKKIATWLEAGDEMVVGGRKIPVADVIARVERGLKGA